MEDHPAAATPEHPHASTAVGPPDALISGDDDLSLPRATVYKMIMEMLPMGVGCSKETRDLLVDCCNEFVHLISSEANEVCEKSGRKTISPEHVLEALKNLGFDDYLEEVQAAHEEHTTQSKEKERIRASSKAEIAKLSQDELLRQQQELFQQARLKLQQQQQQQAAQQTSTSSVPDSPAAKVDLTGEKSKVVEPGSSSSESLALSSS